MSGVFFKRFLYVFAFFTVIVLFANTFFYQQLYEIYQSVGYNDVIPHLLIMSMPAICCMLSLLVAKITVRSGEDSIKFEKVRFPWLIVLFTTAFIISYHFVVNVSIEIGDYLKICYIDLFLLAIVLVTAISLIWFTVSVIKTLKAYKENEDVDIHFFGLFFTLFCIVTSLIVLFAGVLASGHGYDLEDTRFTVFAEFIIITLSSLIIAYLCSKIVPSWQKSPAPAVLLTIFTGVIYLAGIFILFFFWSTSSNMQYAGWYYSDYYSGYPDGVDVVIIDDSDYIEVDTDTEEKIDSVFLDTLWYGLSRQNVTDSLRNVIAQCDTLHHYFGVYDIPTGENAISVDKESDYDHLDAYNRVFSYLDRYRRHIDFASLYLTYKPLVLSVITEERFYDEGYYKILQRLNTSYYDLVEYNHNDEQYDYTKFGEIYKTMKEDESKSYGELYDSIKGYVSDEYLGRFIESGEIDKHLVVWAYSFWGRRHSEGNVETTRKLLDEIAQTYSYYGEEH